MPFTRRHLMQTARSAPPLGRCGPVVLMSTFLVAPDQIDRDHAKACPA